MDISIKGAREHNLRDVDLILPRNKLICFTGVSGSGKSSLAFDTLYAEGQRRYIESLSSFARQFLGQLPKPDVDNISGLSPAISISQKTGGTSPRSTVGTITEIYDFLRVLYARVSTGFCPRCDREITAQTRQQIIDRIETLPVGTKIQILAPVIKGQKGEHKDLFTDLQKQGFIRARVDGEIVRIDGDLKLDRQMRHNIEVVIDRIVQEEPPARIRLAEAVERGLKFGGGQIVVAFESPGNAGILPALPTGTQDAGRMPAIQEFLMSSQFACTHCNISFESPSPQLFSFNNPQGMCPKCDGIGHIHSFDPTLLVPNPAKSIQQGAIVPLGDWAEIGRWRKHIFHGVAEFLEKQHSLPKNTVLETAWDELNPKIAHAVLWGLGAQNITFTWKNGSASHKWGGTYDGIIPKMLQQYRETNSKMQKAGLEKYMNVLPCVFCKGERLNEQARAFRIATNCDKNRFATKKFFSLPQLSDLPISDLTDFFSSLNLSESGQIIASEAVKEIRGRLGFLVNVGLEYLTLARTAPTLSGGELQRIRLASQIGSGLVGVLYVLDEPSIGLHPRDNDRLLETLAKLRDQGNTVVVVEHDEDTMLAADQIVDFGPGPGVHGGNIAAIGNAEDFLNRKKNKNSITARYLSGQEKIEIPETRRKGNGNSLVVKGATHNNLKNVDISIPLGKLVCVTGVSGSGKSSFVNDILIELLLRDLNNGLGQPGAFKSAHGLEHLDKMIAIDQSPIGRTPRSNPATYIKLFDEIRMLYAGTADAKAKGYAQGRFSFNVSGGRCESCEGNGAKKLEMDFLADIWVTCPTCQGQRFNHETLSVHFKDKSIHQVLEMDVEEALEHFENIPKIKHKLQTLYDVGLGYMKLGQASPTLSGGEAQRIKLARELVKRSTGKTLYLLDEPTTGLHFADIKMLLKVLHNFVDAGNTVLIVEHNLDVIKTADWIIDLGPEGGDAGGRIIAEGTPEQIIKSKKSYTAAALKRILQSVPLRLESFKRFRAKEDTDNKSESETHISVRGATENNLKNVSLKIPRNEISVCCGPSGSGKSSLAMDTVYAEGQRRYVESLSSYARQFVGQMQKPRVEHIEGLSPAIAIEQKAASHSPRSTVGTVTEIHDYLRVLFARLGKPYCPHCDVSIGTQTLDEIVAKCVQYKPETRLLIAAPINVAVGQSYADTWKKLRNDGYSRVRIDGQTLSLENVPDIDRKRKYNVELIVDRIVVKTDKNTRSRISESIENALDIGQGVLHFIEADDSVNEKNWNVQKQSRHLSCHKCGRSFEPLTPHHFSFNSPLGYCPHCEGLGVQSGASQSMLIRDPKLSLKQGAVALWPDAKSPIFAKMFDALTKQYGIPNDVPFEQLDSRFRRIIFHGIGENFIEATDKSFSFQYKGLYPALEEAARLVPMFRGKMEYFVDQVECNVCLGSRLRDDASAVRFLGHTMDQISRMPLGQLINVFRKWKPTVTERKIAGELRDEVQNRMQFLIDVGLEYLTLGRPAPSLSGGEAQRIRLAAQIGSGLVGVLYVLDEPTIGLHPRDNSRLISAMQKLRDLGNTLLLVEHDKDVIGNADTIFDFGPKAGVNGGEIVAYGTPKSVEKQKNSVTGPYLSGKKSISVPKNRRDVADCFITGKCLTIEGARQNNLKSIDVSFPLGTLIVVTGVSGSGKSSLIEDILYPALAKKLHRAQMNSGAHDKILGIEHINKVIQVDQQPLGQTPTSNPATYTGVFELIRDLFAQLPEAKMRGYTARRFSFNVAGGRCEKCEGNGQIKIEMHFLPDVWITCDACNGKRYEKQTLDIKYRGFSISDVLQMSCGQALALFQNVPQIRKTLQTLCDVGLDYISLGQSATTLSGGEAQRVKLAAELARPDTGRTLYLLDEPTTGLHFDDLAKLLDVLHRLVDIGNTVVVIEHNLDVIKNADYVIDLGPEAGLNGGQIVFAGTPEKLIGNKKSHTALALAPVLERGPLVARKRYNPKDEPKIPVQIEFTPDDTGANAKMPWETDGRKWHTQDRVGRNGQPCRWDGRILAAVVDRIQESEIFSETNWNNRTIVEICGEKKTLGWHFHAITGEEWLLKMKFRTAKSTFKRDELTQSLDLKTLNEMDDIPLYGNEPRVKVVNSGGPFQEIEMRVLSFEEIDKPAFWQFIDKAIAGFETFTDKAKLKPDEITPWRVLKEKWHLMPKGLVGGDKLKWEYPLLEEIFAQIEDALPSAKPNWTNKVLVPYYIKEASVKGNVPVIRVHTKRVDAVCIELFVQKNTVPLGQILEIGVKPSVDGTNPDYDIVSLNFTEKSQLMKANLKRLIR